MPPLLALLLPNQPGPIMILMLAAGPLTWRTTGPPERASALIMGGLAMLGLGAWWLTEGSSLLDALIGSLALAWMIPVALRANRFYTSVIAAALLIAAAGQWFLAAGITDKSLAVGLLVGLAHLIAVLTYFCGWTYHRAIAGNAGQRPAWREQIPFR